MEAVTAGTDTGQGTGSKTIADLLPLAVALYGDTPAQRFKVGDDWVDVSFNELGEIVREVSLGLVDLGIQPGEKISILAHTRPEYMATATVAPSTHDFTHETEKLPELTTPL